MGQLLLGNGRAGIANLNPGIHRGFLMRQHDFAPGGRMLHAVFQNAAQRLYRPAFIAAQAVLRLAAAAQGNFPQLQRDQQRGQGLIDQRIRRPAFGAKHRHARIHPGHFQQHPHQPLHPLQLPIQIPGQPQPLGYFHFRGAQQLAFQRHGSQRRFDLMGNIRQRIGQLAFIRLAGLHLGTQRLRQLIQLVLKDGIFAFPVLGKGNRALPPQHPLHGQGELFQPQQMQPISGDGRPRHAAAHRQRKPAKSRLQKKAQSSQRRREQQAGKRQPLHLPAAKQAHLNHPPYSPGRERF